MNTIFDSNFVVATTNVDNRLKQTGKSEFSNAVSVSVEVSTLALIFLLVLVVILSQNNQII